MSNFLKNRKSIRDFKSKKINDSVLKDIKVYLDELEKEQEGFKFLLYEDGGKIFKALEGVGGYAGVMIEGPHYIALNTKDGRQESIIFGSYYMEKLITKLGNMNLGSCWISLEGVDEKTKKELFDIKEGSIDYLLAIGHPVAKNPFISEPTSSRLGVEDIVFKDEIGKIINIDELEGRGLDDLFYYVRFAPSAYNKQPWRFILKDNKVVLLLAYTSDEKLHLADAGIIMYYFEGLAKTIGIKDGWKLLKDLDFEYEGCNYKYIGEFSL